MTSTPGSGVVARLRGNELVSAIGDFAVDLRVHDPAGVPSGSLTFEHVPAADIFDHPA